MHAVIGMVPVCIWASTTFKSPYAYGDHANQQMHMGIVQSLTVYVWSLYAYGDLVTRSPHAKICIWGSLWIPVCTWGLLLKIAKILHMEIPVCI
jgi:hypothetical protein